jgi:O-antigen/teichoic acid export membrane protein
MSFINALKWSFLSELAPKAIQPVIFIVLARLLTPEDFGVMTAAIMVIAFSQIFWEAGMGKALIQRQSDIEEAANAAFMINVGLGGLIAGLLYLFAQPIALTFFQDDRVTAVLQVMTLQVLLGAFGSVQTALLQKEMGFKKLFWVRLSTIAIPGGASIPLAMNEWEYWSLVTGSLVGQLAQVIILWRISHWRPGLAIDINVTKDLSRFGLWVGMTGFMVWFYTWVDALIVGMYLGVHELGLFRIGNQFSTMIFGVLLGSITPVLYSHFARFDQDKSRMRTASIKVIKTLSLISIPIGLILFQVSEPIGIAILGGKWNGVGLVIGLMSLVHGFAWIVGMNGEIYRAMNKTFV